MHRLLILLALAALGASAAHAQTVGLQLFDRIVDGEIVNNRPLPEGTQVWLVDWPEARAMRLREGYEPIIAGLATAKTDELAADGQTIGRYATTRVGRRSLYVLAQTPAGDLFQSYVKTGDAGWQPGYDAIGTGRVSMGPVPASVENRLSAALSARETSDARGDEARPGDPPPVTLPDAPQDLPEPDTIAATGDAFDIPDSLAALADSAPLVAAVPPAERDGMLVETEGSGGAPWGWLLGGLLIGGGIGAAVAWSVASRRMQRQRELFAAPPSPFDDPDRY
jgi:hypothetical protein